MPSRDPGPLFAWAARRPSSRDSVAARCAALFGLLNTSLWPMGAPGADAKAWRIVALWMSDRSDETEEEFWRRVDRLGPKRAPWPAEHFLCMKVARGRATAEWSAPVAGALASPAVVACFGEAVAAALDVPPAAVVRWLETGEAP